MPELRHCRGCFSQAIEIPWQEEPSTFAPCDFCGAPKAATWPVTHAAEYIGPLAESYEVSAVGIPLVEALQRDWAPFAGEITGSRRTLLAAVLAASELDTPAAGEPVVPRRHPERDSESLTSLWSAFSYDLRRRSRWFPVQLDEALAILADLRKTHIWIAPVGQTFHRARVCLSDDKLQPDEMKKPPRRLATSGRGNPVGISHFYGAATLMTAVKECRPSHNCTVSIAEFVTTKEFSLLDLTPSAAADPFELALRTEEGATWENYADAATTRSLREHIGAELARPIRPNESEADYASTQFVCEFAKSSGLEGVRYQSAVEPGSWNVVLFDDSSLEMQPIAKHEVTRLDLDLSPVT